MCKRTTNFGVFGGKVFLVASKSSCRVMPETALYQNFSISHFFYTNLLLCNILAIQMHCYSSVLNLDFSKENIAKRHSIPFCQIAMLNVLILDSPLPLSNGVFKVLHDKARTNSVEIGKQNLNCLSC